jgi:hypothetical protein
VSEARAKCETCGSDDPHFRSEGPPESPRPCPDPFHHPATTEEHPFDCPCDECFLKAAKRSERR